MASLWERFQQYYVANEELGLSLDISRMRFSDSWLATMEPSAVKAFSAMEALEKGAIANPDENRMVGHYWLRAPELAPTKELQDEIVQCYADVRGFALETHKSGKFSDVLVIGIGGSALGPQFISDALGTSDDRLRLHFAPKLLLSGQNRTGTGAKCSMV